MSASFDDSEDECFEICGFIEFHGASIFTVDVKTGDTGCQDFDSVDEGKCARTDLVGAFGGFNFDDVGISVFIEDCACLDSGIEKVSLQRFEDNEFVLR